ncbi:MAG: COR domain-containing protein [Bacteroidota bacterium]
MNRISLIDQIEQLLGRELQPAPERPHDPLGGLMAYKTDTPKYLLQDDILIGLNLARCGLTDAQWHTITGWPDFTSARLRALNLSGNALTEFSVLPKMAALERLKLSGNEGLGSLSFEMAPVSLIWLEASNCALTEVVLPAGLDQLTHLKLPNNQLQRWTSAAALPALHLVDLRHNPLEYLPDSLYQSEQLAYLYLQEHQLQEIPQEVIPGGEWENAASSVLAYLQANQKEELLPLFEAKMILVGNGNVGKTSIRAKLLDRDAILERVQTETVDIATYEVRSLRPEETGLAEPIDFQLNIWDFGGQGKYREIQQLFCSRKSLYLFVTACDDQPGRDEYIGFEYWLDMVHAYSFDPKEAQASPVLHILNKIDQAETDLVTSLINQGDRHQAFSNIQKFLRISCQELIGLDELETDIRQILPKVSKDMFTTRYPTSWLAVKSKLEALDEDFISYQEYENLCAASKLDATAAREWIRILNRIGSLIYFGDHSELRDWVILNPLWIKRMMVGLLESRFVREGVLDEMYLADVWPEYEAEAHQKFLALVLNYQLGFAQKTPYGKTEYVIPSRFPKQIPIPAHLRKAPDFRLRFRFSPFLPAGTVNKLMVAIQQGQHLPREAKALAQEEKTFSEARELPTSFLQPYLMWKNHVILHDAAADQNQYAHVWEAWDEKMVYLDLIGGGEDLFEAIQQQLQHLNQQQRDTRYLHQLTMTAEGWFKGDWEPLSKIKKFDQDFFTSQPKDHFKAKTAFFIYASEDESYRAELDKHLLGLKRTGKLETWHDRKITPGTIWEPEILRQLHDSEIILLLLSPDFMAVDFIWKEELEIAREKRGQSHIIPIPLRACDVDDFWFMEHQGPGKRKRWIASEENPNKRDELWLEVVQQLKSIL